MGNNTNSPLLAVEGELQSVALLDLIQFGSFFRRLWVDARCGARSCTEVRRRAVHK